MPLEGEQNSQGHAQRHTNGTRASQQHDASAHGEGHSARAERPSSTHERDGYTESSNTRGPPDGIPEDPGGRVEPSTPDRPPSMPLEGERGHEPSSGRADDRTIVRAHRAQLEVQRGHLEAEEDRQYMGRTRDHTPAPQSIPLEGERNGGASGSDDEPKVKLEDGKMHASTAPPNASATVVHAHANAPSTPIDEEEGRMRELARSATKKNGNDQRTSRVNEDLPRAPPEPPPPILNHPERPCDDTAKSDEPSSPQTRTDAHNEPGSEVAALGDHASEGECPGSETKGRDSVRRRSQSRRVEGEIGDQSDGDDSGRDRGPSSDDSATSNAGRESRRLAPKPLAEDEPNQHKNHERITRNVPGPPQSPTNDHANRPTTPVNPPRRRGRLKTQPARIRQARAYAGTRTRRIQSHDHRDDAGPIEVVGCRGYGPEMQGEYPRAARIEGGHYRDQHDETTHPHTARTRDAP
ncbi:hypothetical protein BU15DRAFT_77093 [Melanogaster broomeanus]|nr:hypothetical protein BU15DRAFT_77093 [Melanogaster broomeanus]